MTALLSLLSFAVGLLAGAWMVWAQLLAHECAHAAAFWLLGGHVNTISVGSGRFVWSRSVRGCRLELRPLWKHGLVYGGFTRPTGLRWRWILVYLSGPIASTAVAMAFWLAVLRIWPTYGTSGIEVGATAFVRAAAWTTTAAAITSWMPRAVKIGGVEFPSDVRGALEAVGWDEPSRRGRAEEAALTRGHHLAWQAFLAGDPVAAERRLAALPLPEERLGLRDIDSAIFVWASAGPAAALAAHRRGVERLRAAELGDEPFRRHLNLMCQVNELFLLTQDGSPTAMTAAEGLARELDGKRTREPSVKRTLGLYCLHAGRTKYGMSLLRDAWRSIEPAWLRALCATYLAYGHALEGAPARARRFLRRARRLHPQCHALPRYRRLIEALSPALRAS